MPELPLEFRREILGPLAAKLHARKSTQLLGVGSCGKSNIVRHLARADVQALYFRQAAPTLLYLNVDCQDLADFQDASVYALILRELGRKLGARADAAQALQPQVNEWYRATRVAGGDGFARDHFEDALNLLLDGPIQLLILLFDDCDDLIRHASPALLKSLRALRDDHKEQMAYATATRRELALLETRAPGQKEMSSEFESFFELFSAYSIAITPYLEDDAKMMLHRLEAREDIVTAPLNQHARSELLRVSGGHAGLIKAGYEILKGLGRMPDENMADYLFRKQLIYAECKKIWQSLEPDEHADLAALVRGTKPEGSGLNPLQKKGLIRKRNDSAFDLFSPLFDRFVREEIGASAAQPSKAAAPASNTSAAPNVTFDASNYTVIVNGRPIQLKRVEADLFDYLFANRARACSLGELLTVMVRHEAGANLQQSLERQLYHLAAKLNVGGLIVLTHHPDKSWQVLAR